MRKITGLFLFIILISCHKDSDKSCNPADPASEAPSLQAFCTMNNINYTVDSNGIYYEITDPGSGEAVADNSFITVTYTSQFLNGAPFTNTTEPVSDYVRSFIEGWRIALPYIKKGGHIKMAIPSSLCYGCAGCCDMKPGLIAPNTPIYYDIVLIDVKN